MAKFNLKNALKFGVGAGFSGGGRGGGGDSGGGFEYPGPRPPEIDTAERKFLRPTQALTTDIISPRAQGIGVGYDPERRTTLEALLKSNLDKRQEDEVRSAQGMAGRSGLSGNLAAQNALEGRVRRDVGRTYGEGLANITIEDLARANQERDTNTERLRALNEFNFGQENRRADFGLREFLGESGLNQNESQFNRNFGLSQQELADARNSELAELATYAGVSALSGGNPIVMAAAPQALGALGDSGTGIKPPSSVTGSYGSQPSDTFSALVKRRSKSKSGGVTGLGGQEIYRGLGG